MAISLTPLPYGTADLEPLISAKTLEVHYGKHHADYVKKLNALIAGTPLEALTLEQIIAESAGNPKHQEIFNNAGQVWNHDFFWASMTPPKDAPKSSSVHKKIESDFGSLSAFADEFVKTAVHQFGSGWTWLISVAGKLKVVSTANAEMPLIKHQHALLVCDVWEHAYYLDYQNERDHFARTFIEKLANWKFAEERLAKTPKS